jgi:hypothetical protein
MSDEMRIKQLGICELLDWARERKVEWAQLNTANEPDFIAVAADEKGMSRIIARSDSLYTCLNQAYNDLQAR